MKRSLCAAFLLAGLTSVISGCATGPTLLRPVDEDLRVLLPHDIELIFDIEMKQLREWHLARDVKDLVYRRLPIPHELAEGLWNVEAFTGGARGLTMWSRAEFFVVARGELTLTKDTPIENDGGHQVAKLGDRNVVWVGHRLVAYGSPPELDKLLDRIEHRREAGPQGALAEALATAPTGKYTRPAVMFAMTLDEEMRGRLKEALPILASADSVALSLAVADGFDLGIVVRMPSETDARAAAAKLRSSLQTIANRPVIAAFGLGELVEPLQAGVRERDIHLAYRLSRPRAEELMGRLRAIVRLIEGAPKGDHE